MADADESERLVCKVCGRTMVETSMWDAPFPPELVVRLVPYGLHPMSFRHFACPKKHAGIIKFSAVGERGPKVRNDLDPMVN
jgi:hypothetical protein